MYFNFWEMLLLCICVILYFPTAFAFLVEVVFLCALCVQVNFLCMSCRLCLFPNQFWTKTRVICFQKKYPRPILPIHVPILCMQSFILSQETWSEKTNRQTQVNAQTKCWKINMEWLHFIMLAKMDNLTWFLKFFCDEIQMEHFWYLFKHYV